MAFSTNVIRNSLTGNGKTSVKLPVIITSLHELTSIIYNHSPKNTGIHEVKLGIDDLSGELNARLEQNTNQFLSSCGCNEGTFSGISLLLLRLVLPGEGGWLFSNAFVDIPMILFIGAIAGKILTYLVLRFKLTRQLRKASETTINEK
jgi:hypothetical protein